MDVKKLAWLGDPNLKEKVVLRMKQHRAEDSIIQGYYQVYAPEFASQFKGCLLGCTLPNTVSLGAPVSCWGDSWHRKVEQLYGIPSPVAYLLEAIFENLSFKDAADFAVESIEAIPVGADLSGAADYWRHHEDDGYWIARKAKAPVLALLRNAPVPEPINER